MHGVLAIVEGNALFKGVRGLVKGIGTARRVKIPFAELSTEDAVKKLAIKAERAIAGEGMHAGRDKHIYIKKLMDKYKDKFKGHAGVEFEETVKNTERGLRGRLDVIDNPNKIIYDFKFGKTGMSEKQLAKYRELKPGYTIKVIDKAGKIIAEHAPQNN